MKNRFTDITQKVNAYESPVPPLVWANIQQQRTWKDKWRNLFAAYRLPIVASSLLFMASVGLFLLPNQPQDLTPITPQKPSLSQTQQAAPIANNPSENAPSNEQQKDFLVNNLIKEKSDAEVLKIQDNSLNTQTLNIKNKFNLFNSNELLFLPKVPKFNSFNKKETTLVSEEIKQEIKEESTEKQAILPIISNETSNNDVTINEAITSIAAPENIAPATIPSLLSSYQMPNWKPDPCYSFKKQISKNFYIDLLASPDYNMRKLSAKNSDTAPEYSQLRDSLENIQLGFSAMLRASLLFGNGIALRAGVNYSQKNELFKYKNENWTQTTILETTLPDGTIVRDTVVQTGTRNIQTQNHLRTIDVPVMLGYEVALDNWTIGANAGAILNFYFSQKGKMIAPNGLPVDFTRSAENPYAVFTKSVGTTLYGGLSFGCRLNERTHLLIEPHIKYQMKSLTLDEYPLGQRYTTIGVFAGLRYEL